MFSLLIDSFSSPIDLVICSDEDLLSRRKEQRVDPVSGTIYPKMIYDPDKDETAAMVCGAEGFAQHIVQDMWT